MSPTSTSGKTGSGALAGPYDLSGDAIWAGSPWGAKVRLATMTIHSPMNGIDWKATGTLFAASWDLLRAAQLLEAAENFHANCEECEGLGIPELCGECFPHFDNARVARRKAIEKASALSTPTGDAKP